MRVRQYLDTFKDHLNLFRLKMKSTISVLLSFALPFVIYGANIPVRFDEEVKNINTLAKNGTEINREFLLKTDGFLGEGSYGFVYEGTMIKDERPVAIKFFKNKCIKYCEREMATYSYLKAYKNESVEKYGIPVVYYYGPWQNYILMALTKFDIDLKFVSENITSFGKNHLNIMILLRDFVYQSKYLHSHGVRHDDIKPANIMLRGHRSFLIDLNSSSKMMEDYHAGTQAYRCKRLETQEKRRAIDDYESFIYTICAVMNEDWFKPQYDDNIRRKNDLRDEGLESIIKAFADEVFTDDASKRFPDYNNLEKIVSGEIKRIHPNGEPKFSCITTDAETSPARKIKDIAQPKSFNFTRFVYPPIAVHLHSEQATQNSMPPTKRSRNKILDCFSPAEN